MGNLGAVCRSADGKHKVNVDVLQFTSCLVCVIREKLLSAIAAGRIARLALIALSNSRLRSSSVFTHASSRLPDFIACGHLPITFAS